MVLAGTPARLAISPIRIQISLTFQLAGGFTVTRGSTRLEAPVSNLHLYGGRERVAPMTADTPAVTVDALDAALATAAGSLAEDGQRLAGAAFRLLAAAEPATP